jgi:hypothetical protein
MNPSNTLLPSIKSQPAQPTNYKKLSSSYNGVNLYSYSQDTYNLQNMIQTLAMILGYLSLGFMMIGFFLPVGKLIVV